MSMDDFIQTLSSEQREALLKALVGDHVKKTVDSIAADDDLGSDLEEVLSEEPVKTKPKVEDFTMRKDGNNALGKTGRKEPVKAKANTWTDTGEHKDVSTPDAARTPRNRVAPKKKKVRCHICGKDFTINASLVYGEYYRCDRCIG